ncbi:MAG: hypothetical protein ACUVRR_13300 [Candidatus Fervidibacter sp.]|uniref:hypothetical protein n=1 Tax=Candidatus Fervidibacter sp. TaxID=3100871 RepID=UPI004049D6D9
MKQNWLFVWVLVLLAPFSLVPSQTGGAHQWLVSFQQQTGGLLSLLSHPEVDKPRLTSMTIYTDWGILNPGRYEPVGSQNERNPKVKEQVIEGKRLLVVEGELKDKQGQHCGLSYQVTYALERDKVEMDIAIRSARPFPTMNGFLAAMINFSGATEWFARIRKGWLFAEIIADKRVFQSAQTPLDDNFPTLGIANSKTGLAIVLTLKEITPADSLDNIIIHANPSGNGGLFLAWCDGVRVRKMGEGESWRVSVQLQFLRLDEMLLKRE